VTVYELSERFRIPVELLRAAGVTLATDGAVRELLGVHGRTGQELSGLVFPYHDPRNGRPVGHRVRLSVTLEDGQKYLSEQGCRALYFPPNCGNELASPTTPVVIVEAEKSVLAVTALASRHDRKFLTLAVGGVYGWRRQTAVRPSADGGHEKVTGPSPSFDWIEWKFRKVVIAFDSNVAGRRDLAKARIALASELEGRGAHVFIANVPRCEGINGPDDMIAVKGDAAVLEMLDRAVPARTKKPNSTSGCGFSLTALGELLSRPSTPVDYVVEGMLSVGGVSGVCAKPKVGKSTFARNLCLAVARGSDFLGRKTRQGTCLYLALEEREEDICKDFRAMGADGSEPIHVHAASAPSEGIAALCALVREREPVLVVIDPLFRIARIRDEKAYAETYAALGPLIDVARETGTHVLFTHHSGKSQKADSIDAPLGSTAIGGAVSTLVILKRTTERRTIETVQRVGTNLSETILEFDLQSFNLTLGGSRFDDERHECQDTILEFVESEAEPQTHEQIRKGVEGKTTVIRAALTALVNTGAISRMGDGKRGTPFLYSVPNSGSEPISGTSKPDSEKSSQPLEKHIEMVVPDAEQVAILVPGFDSSDDTVRV
jgi:hypothetical protein